MARVSMNDRKKRKPCNFCADKIELIDYKDTIRIRRYLTERGKILPRRITGNCAKHQRDLTIAVKNSRQVGLIGYIFEG